MYLLFLRQSLTLQPRLERSGAITAHYSLDLLGSSNLPTSGSPVAGNYRHEPPGQAFLLLISFLAAFFDSQQNILSIITLSKSFKLVIFSFMYSFIQETQDGVPPIFRHCARYWEHSGEQNKDLCSHRTDIPVRKTAVKTLTYKFQM